MVAYNMATIAVRGDLIEDEGDEEAKAQRSAARALLESGQRFYVPLSAIRELERIMRGVYEFGRNDAVRVLEHLLGLSSVETDSAAAVGRAVEWHRRGLDFSDALHLALSAHCAEVATFDRGFANRARRLGLKPPVSRPQGADRALPE